MLQVDVPMESDATGIHRAHVAVVEMYTLLFHNAEGFMIIKEIDSCKNAVETLEMYAKAPLSSHEGGTVGFNIYRVCCI